ncbi:uncharacterized protein LOC120911126 [Rana temporaria]|uniref:uncharacterized protein LOC120911126 n=1 Tax=Rana temporaria TaxID=8407 RepID=UPI001AAD1A6B|nr:uncharacterized protein LOC120911126 [Rana temporaria]
MLKTKWKSIRDAFTCHLRVQRERRSGSAACAPKDYLHSKELEFLRPLLALGSTENCWEEGTPNNDLDTDANNSQPASQASGDQAGQEPESQLSTSSRSTSATPVGDDKSTPTVCACVPARGTRRKAPEPDFNRILDIMANMSDRMSSNRSYGHISARCLEGLLERVPIDLQADMLAGTIRYIVTFIPPTTPYQSSEPPPPYGPYATHPPHHPFLVCHRHILPSTYLDQHHLLLTILCHHHHHHLLLILLCQHHHLLLTLICQQHHLLLTLL